MKFKAYISLLKPRILLMVLITTVLGFFLGAKAEGVPVNSHYLYLLFGTLLGTTLSCGGACALNHYLERDVDAKMKRTANRPLPRGIIAPSEALIFGVALVLSGVIFLAACINLLTGFLALMTCFLYVLLYTPLKRVTWLNTFVGAIPGALPPMGGWTAASGELHIGAWVLFLILFLWQHPHFYAIAWMYKEDYARGGMKMLPVVDPAGQRTFRQIFVYLGLLVPTSLLPSLFGISGWIYFLGALILGLWIIKVGVHFAASRSISDARRLLKASVVYLPVLFILIALDVQW